MGDSPGVIGRLLEEISWEGNATPYRDGGRGRENVLSAEVFQALDFLPRSAFLGQVIASATGADPDTLRMLEHEVEQASISLLPGNCIISEFEGAEGDCLVVQPDAIIESPGVYCLVEAKGFKAGGFQLEQLARELMVTIQEAQGRRPLLLLILAEDPPVLVRRHGRHSIENAVLEGLPSALERIGAPPAHGAEIASQVDSVIAYITWDGLRDVISRAHSDYQKDDPSLVGTVSRLCNAITTGVDWHSRR